MVTSVYTLEKVLEAGPGKVILREYAGEGHGFFNLGRSKSDVQMNADILEFLEAEDPASA